MDETTAHIVHSVCRLHNNGCLRIGTCRNARKHFGSAPDPAEGVYIAPSGPLAGGEGDWLPLPQNPTPSLGPHSKISSDAAECSNIELKRRGGKLCIRFIYM